MAIQDVINRLDFNYFPATTDEQLIAQALTYLYTNSTTAKSLLDIIVTENKTLTINYESGMFAAPRGEFLLKLDLSYLNNRFYISPDGKAVPYDLAPALAHELIHAIEGLSDDGQLPNFAGPTVEKANIIHNELGIDERLSYSGVGVAPTVEGGKEYTGGMQLDTARVTSGEYNVLENGHIYESRDLLIGTDITNDNFSGWNGNDFLYGNGSNDILAGNAGNDYLDGGDGEDTAVFSGNFEEYKFTEVSDTEWIVEHRNGGVDGTDRLIDIEKVQFADTTKNLPLGNDMAILIDISGSMGDDIAAVQSSAQSILDAVFGAESSSIDNRVGILTFNNIGDISPITNFTGHASIDDRKAAALAGISSVTLSNGGMEPLNGALLYALEGGLGTWREDAVTRRIIVFSDEPPADPELAAQVQQAALNPAVDISSGALLYRSSAMSITQTLAAASGGYVEIFTVAIGDNSAAISALAQIAADNHGQAFLAADASELVAALLEAINAPSQPEPEPVLIEGTNAYDLLYGGDDAEGIFAYDGNDDVYAGKGNDILHGGNGHDMLVGDEGNDFISGDAGNDELFGNDGNDTIEGGSGYDILAGGNGDDSLFGGTQEDELFGEAGNDTLDGGAHADYLEGGSGNDSLAGGDGNDELYGQADNDTLDGDNGNDNLYGAGGNDILISGKGDDYLEGGAGSDIFRFDNISNSSMVDGIDYIGDFTRGTDKIDLTGLGFTSVSNFQVYNESGYTEIYDDTTGFALGFNGDISLQNSDFIF